MKNHVSVNGIRVPILEALPPEKAKGKPKGSIIIISYDCEIYPECKKYCDLYEIKIIRMN